jgi:serine/threonine protein kinase
MAAAAETGHGQLLGGRYRLDAPIGLGGMGTVFRAHDESLGRPVAVKLFLTNTVDGAGQETELAILASLDHHSVVSLLDAGTYTDENGRPGRFIVMSFVKGTDLHQRLSLGPIAPRNIAEIGYDIAEALDYIHSRTVVHRDIKPSNILLVNYSSGSARARARLTDFGIALSEDAERMTAEGATRGTAAYLSPEQASGRDVGPPTDVYSLGLVLLQCFTRRVEFPGSLVESALARLSRDPVIPEGLSDHWRALLTAMTAREPAHRPEGRELVSMLRQVVIADSARHKDPEWALFPQPAEGQDLAQPSMFDTLPDEALHRVTAMAARLFSAPISIISVVDHDRTWFTSHYGAELEKIALEVDLSKMNAPQPEPVIVPDTRLDPRSRDSPLVTGPLGLRFYVGVPLKRADGQVIGTLSVLDVIPGTATATEMAHLTDLAALVVTQLELRQAGMRNTEEMSGSIATRHTTSDVHGATR